MKNILKQIVSFVAALALVVSPAMGAYNPLGGTSGQIQYNNNGALGGTTIGTNTTAYSAVKTAIANTTLGLANTRICVMGDSTKFGAGSLGSGSVYSGNLVAGSAPTQLSNYLQSIYGLHASWQGFMGDGVSSTGTNFGADDSRIVMGSSWSRDFTNTSFGVSTFKATTSTNTLDFTPTVPVDTFRFLYLTIPGNGTLSVQIDSGTPVTYNTNAANALVPVVLSAGSVATHTIHFSWSAGGQVNLAGVSEAYDSTYKWVNVLNMGAVSAKVADLATLSAGFGTTTNAAWAALGCNAVLFQGAINDWGSTPTSILAYTASVNSFLTPAAASGASVIVETPHPTSNSTVPTQQSFVEADRAIANAGAYGYIDIYNRYGTYATLTAELFTADSLHLNFNGYGDVALVEAAKILGEPGEVSTNIDWLNVKAGNFFADTKITTADNFGLTVSSTGSFGAGIIVDSSSTGGHIYKQNSTSSSNTKTGYFNIGDQTSGSNSFAVYGGTSSTAGQLVSLSNANTLCWSSTSSDQGTCDTGLSRDAAGVVDIGAGVQGDTSGRIKAAGLIAAGTKFTATGCAISATTGGASAGAYTSGTAGTCTVVITPGFTAPNGFSCFASDLTTTSDIITQTAGTTTTATLSGTTASGDIVHFGCMAY